jgi:chromosome partitioning protein
MTRRPDEAPQVDEERGGGFLSKLLAALGLRRRTRDTDRAGDGEQAQGKSVRSASPPATTMERAGIAEGSPAGETSGRGAVPGPAQDGETSTVDQSREWPYRDTAPRQDPTGSRLDPIWGADPPDAARWHMDMDMTADEETATTDRQDAATNVQAPQSQPNRNGTTEAAGSTGSASAGGSGRAAAPAELPTAYGESSAATSRNAGSEAGWFSTDSDGGDSGAAQDGGALSEQLSAVRPGDEPSHELDAGVQASAPAPGALDVDAPARVAPVGTGSSTLPGGPSGIVESSHAAEAKVPEESPGGKSSAGAGKPMDGIGSSPAATGQGSAGGPPGAEGPTAAGVTEASVGPQAAIGRDNASFGTGSEPGGQELRGPELIQSGMVYVDPDPEIGSPPSAAGWTEQSALVPNEGASGRTTAAMPEGSGEEQARARNAVDSPGADRPGGREDDPTSTAEPTPTDRGGASVAADEPAAASTADVPTNALPRDVTRSSQAGSAAPTEVSGSFSPAPPSDAEDASIGEETAGPGAATHEVHGSAGTVAVAALAAEAGSAATEGGAAPTGVREVGGEPSGEVVPGGTDGTGGRDEGEAQARDASEIRDEAGGVIGPADAAEASPDSTVAETPWDEPALPMGWPPGMAPPAHGETTAPGSEEDSDPELVPDPTWPRLFDRGSGDDGSGGPDDLSNGGQAATGPLREINGEQTSEGVAQSPYAQPEEPILESGGGGKPRSTAGPGGPTYIPDDRSASRASSHPAGQFADQGMAAPEEAPVLEPSDAVAAGAAGGTSSSPAPGDADSRSNSNPAIVDVTTGEPESGSGPGLLPEPARRSAEAGALDAGVVAADADASRNTNVSTAVRQDEKAEVDLREPNASSVDVSRETSADGGEAMDPEREDEALEDEAAIAVRDAVSRAAAEAGVDVSRETDPLATDVSINEPAGEAVIDSESAARNARVTFRIHQDTRNGIRRVLAVANQKGGVGKSTTAVNIGAYLALAGARVLVIDLDPQGNASTGLGLDHREIEPSIYDVLTGEAAPGAAIRATGVPGLHVLPSTIDLAGAEVELVSAMSRETRLRRALQSVDHQYDTILIDCPPSLGLLTVNALAAADELLIPIQCEYYALEGLGQLLRNVELVRANLNPELRIGGIVLTMYDGRTRLALQVVEEVRKHFTDIVYQTVVPRSVRLSEAPGYGLPIALYDPLSRGGIAYRDLTFELAERSGLLAPTGEGAS